jgi:succinyl-CoA synthetase beta subunit
MRAPGCRSHGEVSAALPDPVPGMEGGGLVSAAAKGMGADRPAGSEPLPGDCACAIRAGRHGSVAATPSARRDRSCGTDVRGKLYPARAAPESKNVDKRRCCFAGKKDSEAVPPNRRATGAHSRRRGRQRRAIDETNRMAVSANARVQGQPMTVCPTAHPPLHSRANMKIHEYQARQILAEAGVPVPPAEVVRSPDEAATAFGKFNAPMCVVKAQVYAGGRGKAGFVKLVKSADEAREAAKFMLSNRMVSYQTGPEGVPVSVLIVAPGVDIAKEYYLGIVMDRARQTATVIASAEGGMEIEEVAKKSPEKVLKEPLHPLLGIQPYQARELAFKLGFKDKMAGEAAKIITNLAKAFVKYDASLAEINPLVITKDGKLLAIDAKFNFDDNALFRHKDIEAMADESQEKPLDVRAKKANLNYIALDGNIGCLVNGAGLAMATMDIIKLHGAEPANFLDVGGSVTSEGAVEAFSIILADPKVKGILVNIFGGIAKCDLIAEALVTAGRQIGFKVPVVVRLEGTNVDRAREILKAAHKELPTIQSATDLTDAAKKVVAAVA